MADDENLWKGTWAMKQLCCALLGLSFMFIASTAHAQARLTIVNQSQRQMTVKVMRTSLGEDTLHDTIHIDSSGSQTVYFSETGEYFTKTMAILSGKDPVYQKGQPFKVYNGTDGYSVITATFSITESEVPLVTGGRQISKQEFEQNSSKR
jgi:hypothetical protein